MGTAFNDLFNSFREQRLHFLGSIILKQLPSSMGERSRRSLIDGQQRLTTFYILVKSIYDLLDEDRLVDYVGFLYTEPTKYKKHSHINRSSCEAITKAKDYSELCESKDDDKLFACYKYFSEKLKESSLKNNEIINFLNYIVRTELWVVINLNGNEDEQKIFDSINLAGMVLSSTDIIKNAIFDRLIKSGDIG